MTKVDLTDINSHADSSPTSPTLADNEAEPNETFWTAINTFQVRRAKLRDQMQELELQEFLAEQDREKKAGEAKEDRAREDKAREDKAKEDKAKEDKAKEGKAKESRAKDDQAEDINAASHRQAIPFRVRQSQHTFTPAGIDSALILQDQHTQAEREDDYRVGPREGYKRNLPLPCHLRGHPDLSRVAYDHKTFGPAIREAWAHLTDNAATDMQNHFFEGFLQNRTAVSLLFGKRDDQRRKTLASLIYAYAYAFRKRRFFHEINNAVIVVTNDDDGLYGIMQHL